MSLLEIRDLSVHFPVKAGPFGKPHAWVKAVDRVRFDIDRGEAVGLVGESGCGKTTLSRAILRLIEPTSGSVSLQGEELTKLTKSQMRGRRRQIQMIFQDPYNSLNPRLIVEGIIGEALDIHRLARTRNERRQRVEELLRLVGLEPIHRQRYPHEFSGGQRQRIGIARALAVAPQLSICDEPVSALDVSVQAQIVNLLKDLQEQKGLAYLFIAHDLAVVEHICQRILVMYLGRIVEEAPSATLVKNPKHPYTQALISAVPVLDAGSRKSRMVVPGELPSPIHPPPGCPFHPRCPLAQDICRQQEPQLRPLSPTHKAACHLASTEP
jgi:oligopeptide/dipeptide ABC transporter ATP-binding protein